MKRRASDRTKDRILIILMLSILTNVGVIIHNSYRMGRIMTLEDDKVKQLERLAKIEKMLRAMKDGPQLEE